MAGRNNKNNILQGGGGSITRHTIPEEEKESFVEHINRLLVGDKDLNGVVPIPNNTLDLFTAVRNGVLLAKMIEATVPGTVALQKLETKRLNAFNIISNHNITIDAAKAIGCNLINIGAEDLREGKPILVMGLIWQIIKIGIVLQMQNIIKRLGLQAEYEGVKNDPQEILLLWVNSHLRRAGYPKVIKNFEGDIKDGEVYSILLNQLAPNLCPLEPMLRAGSDLKRAELVLDNAEKLGARKFVHAGDIVSGNARLNFAFTAGLFSISPSVTDVTPVVKPVVAEPVRSADDDELASSERRTGNSATRIRPSSRGSGDSNPNCPRARRKRKRFVMTWKRRRRRSNWRRRRRRNSRNVSRPCSFPKRNARSSRRC